MCIEAKTMALAFEGKKAFIILGFTYKETGDIAPICLFDPGFRVGFKGLGGNSYAEVLVGQVWIEGF